jgi:hypothetical protein
MGKSDDSKREDKRRKPYEKPKATKLTAEKAKLKLVDHVSRGDEGAKGLLEMMFLQEAKKFSTREKKPA